MPTFSHTASPRVKPVHVVPPSSLPSHEACELLPLPAELALFFLPEDLPPTLAPSPSSAACSCSERCWAAIAADSLLLSPLFYFPCFYLFTHSLVRRESPARALRLYADEAATQLPVLWAFWVPANGFMFACVPAHLRVAYCTAAVTGYVAVLSRVTQLLIRKRKTEAGAV